MDEDLPCNYCINLTFKVDWILADAENISAMREDVQSLLTGPEIDNNKYYILCALSDVHNLMSKALECGEDKKETDFSKKFPSPHFPSVSEETKDKIKLYMKKIEYFLSYTKDCM